MKYVKKNGYIILFHGIMLLQLEYKLVLLRNIW